MCKMQLPMHLKNLQNDVNVFLKNPTQENAKKLVEKYDLATNSSGEKLYIQSIITRSYWI